VGGGVGEIHRAECAAGQIGRHHQRPERHARHDAVADGKTLFVRRAVERELLITPGWSKCAINREPAMALAGFPLVVDLRPAKAHPE
jgi:hypothetical protein